MKRPLSLLLIVFMLSGCVFNSDNPYPYRGENQPLYTAAIYSIPHAEGYMHHGEGAFDADIHIWEQDDYGRTLFSYCEDFGNQVFALVICQAYDEADVYFYPEVNYVLTQNDSQYAYNITADDHLKNQTEAFYLASREKLKADNDWGEPLDKNRCVSYPITDHKILGEHAYSLSDAQCNEILNEYTKTLHLSNPSQTPHRYHRVLQTDTEGRVLHEIFGVHQHHDNPYWYQQEDYTSYDIVLWVITDGKGHYDHEKGIMVMLSAANVSDTTFVYDAEDVLEFKNSNGWK